jgi:hypothetical protein
MVGCGAEEPRKPPPVQGGGEGGVADDGEGGADSGSGGKSDPSPTCKEGSQKECTEYVTQANGVTSCWKGSRFCVDGHYTECLEPGAAVPGAD